MVTGRTLTWRPPAWAAPLIPPRRYKAAKGGRAGGKSHFWAEWAVIRMASDPSLRVVGIREIQKSIDLSIKSLIEMKIAELGLESYFKVQDKLIKRVGGTGLVAFQGMQDHNADTIKGLAEFDVALVDEANALSQRSIEMLTKTLRREGSELWFAWNPDQPIDPVERFFAEAAEFGDDRYIVATVNVTDNPHASNTAQREYLEDLRRAQARPDLMPRFRHIWRGEFNLISEAIVFAGCWSMRDFDVKAEWDGPYYGLDFGFAQDPTALVEAWVDGEAAERTIYVRRAEMKVGLEIDHTTAWARKICPDVERHTIRADSARPETISFLRRSGLGAIAGVDKWPGCVEDRVAWLRSARQIIVHSTDAAPLANELERYSYQRNKAGDVLPKLLDKHNHAIDALGYALTPLVRARKYDFGFI